MPEMVLVKPAASIATDMFNGLEFVLKGNEQNNYGTVMSASYDTREGLLYFTVGFESNETIKIKAYETVALDSGWFRSYTFRKDDIKKEENRLADIYKNQVKAYETEERRIIEEENKKREEEAEQKRLAEEIRLKQLGKEAEEKRLARSEEYERIKKEDEQRKQANEAEKVRLREMRHNYVATPVYTLHSYYPYKYWKYLDYPEDRAMSKRILAYKNCNVDEIISFTVKDFFPKIREVCHKIAENGKCDRIVLIPIPCSKSEKVPATKYTVNGIVHVMNEKNIFPDIRFVNGDGLITREYDIASAHECPASERPDCMDNFKSMKCNIDSWKDQLTQDTWYILLDDIRTRGLQMRACEYRLIDSGVPNDHICCIALGQTEKVFY